MILEKVKSLLEMRVKSPPEVEDPPRRKTKRRMISREERNKKSNQRIGKMKIKTNQAGLVGLVKKNWNKRKENLVVKQVTH